MLKPEAVTPLVSERVCESGCLWPGVHCRAISTIHEAVTDDASLAPLQLSGGWRRLEFVGSLALAACADDPNKGDSGRKQE